MARSRESFWTPQLLRDLLRHYARLSSRELLERYEKPLDEINRAYDFALADKQLRISQEKIKRQKGQRAYTITIYACAHHRGTVENPLEIEE